MTLLVVAKQNDCKLKVGVFRTDLYKSHTPVIYIAQITIIILAIEFTILCYYIAACPTACTLSFSRTNSSSKERLRYN